MVVGFGGIRELTLDQRWQLLRSHSHGRIAASAAGTQLRELSLNDRVAFEIAGSEEQEAWSVVAKGRAEHIARQSEMDAAESLGSAPWTAAPTYRWVRITATSVTGRRFSLGTEPSRL